MSEPYFMYDMPREQVEQVLMPYQTGAFLVRFSIHCTREAPFVLSFRGTYPRHTRIYWQLGSPGYSTTISAAVGQESAPTLQGLITKLHARGVLTTPFKGERIHTTGYYSD
ncbi:hypothetical protein Pelo_10747 [Pelomyxa schiedti]|nr:hypothetical protein Pelo_10747 [Pelomyxa schiedti]